MNAQRYSRKAVKRIELVVLVAVLAVAAFVGVTMLRGSRVAARRETCLANLGRIGQAFSTYLNEHDQRWPYVEKLASMPVHQPAWPTLPVALAPYTGSDPGIFHCPADRRDLASDSPLRARFSGTTTWFETEGTSYEYWLGEAYGGKKVGEELLSKAGGYGQGRADQWLLADFERFHKGDDGGSFNTLNADLKPRTTRAKQ